MYSSLVTTKETISICLSEILNLAGMCSRLLMSGRLQSDERNEGQPTLFDEYKQIIRGKDLNRQFIRDIMFNDFVLGCIDPRYRLGKPFKFQLHTRETILVMYNVFTRTNVIDNYIPDVADCKSFPLNVHSARTSMEKFELLPKEATQIDSWHFVHRPAVEFNFVDTYSSLYQVFTSMLAPKAIQY